jgi:GAF domain-containing protein/HAMP domain-containing protein
MKNWLANFYTETTKEGRAAFRIALIIAGAVIISLPIAVYTAVQTGAWQLYTALIGIIIYGLINLFSALLARRNRVELSARLMIGSASIIIPFIVALISGLGFVLGPTLILLVAVIVVETLSGATAGRALLIGALFAVLTIVIEVFVPWQRFGSPVIKTYIPVLAIVVVIVSGYFVAQRFRDFPLRIKVITALVGITVDTVAVLASYLLNQVYQNAYNTAATQITTENQEHILSLQTFLSQHSQDAIILSQLPDLKDLIADEQTGASPTVLASDTSELNQDMQAFFNVHPVYDNVRFIDASGQEVVKVNSNYISTTLQNKATRPFFAIPSKLPAGSLYISPLELEQDLGQIIVPRRPVIRFATPVYYNNKLAGVIVVNILAENFLNIVNDPSHHVMLVDQNGYYLYDNQLYDVDRSVNKLFGGPSDLNTGSTIAKDMPAYASSLLSGKSGSFVDQGNIYFYTPITVLNGKAPSWFLLYEVPQAEIYAVANQTLTISLLILGAILLVAIALAIYLGNTLTAPVISLTQTAQEAAQGNLSVRSNVTTNDEIGVLANTFNLMTSQLSEQIRTLDQRVSERTREVESQALRVRSAAEIARDISSAPNLNELLVRSSELIVDRFKFYHAGIFLLDDKKEYAVLRASPTEAGKQLIANSHRLRVGEQGIVGRVAATGEARIALDTGADAIYFNNPFLPTTRSEMALPLKTSNEIIGVLDIQSDQPQAFAQEDIDILQVMADQLAIAIERIQLLEQVQNQLKEIEQTYQEFTRQSWQGFARSENRIAGYKFDGLQLQAINRVTDHTEETNQNDSKNLSATQSDDSKSQAIPIRLRGQTIGFVNIRLREEASSGETVMIVEQIADRLASALENARLNEETRQRAQRDALVAEVTGHFRSTLDLEIMLRTATQELQKAFQLEEAEVRLGFPTPESGNATKGKARKNGGSHE